ncbi:PepSY domain-containing protein [Costertonia aggregata]|uniref:PepSY domain-containing protein n=1 Tax=Costertonia aggregata TaxID=343403 RepID=A0A7H9AS54_9FLAO|nr:PepSY domain-containing protein [Costertonia aggregata]QLG46284.1 PepSY domain-containing protein [Costertonia aggregata]
MTVSIWRYSHLLLALASALFLTIASLTGIVLAFEPMQNAVQPYHIAGSEKLSLSETMVALNSSYDEVLSLEIDANDFISASVITKSGESETIYIHPKTAEKLGSPKAQAPIFQFATNLHRSLFLKGLGRFFVGLVSFLLCLIAITGLFLILKRQGGLMKLFSKVQKEYFELRYHVIFGRLFLLPIIIIAATGVYLSAEKFSLLPENTTIHELKNAKTEVDLSIEASELPIFKTIVLKDVKSVNFPFSKAPEDYFEVSLSDREIYVHQYTGEVLSEIQYPFTVLASRWSTLLHTGQGSFLWSVILLLASVSILFFIYTGIVMWRRRTKNTKIDRVDKDECSHIILVGSETGSTFGFAKLLKQALVKSGKSVFLGKLNSYSTYKKAQHLIVLTATYGDGQPTTNARKFEQLFKTVQATKKVQYSVVGFGSLLYPRYCSFAVTVENLLDASPYFEQTIPLYKINNQDERSFLDWAKKWEEKTSVSLKIKFPEKKKKQLKKNSFRVVEKTDLNKDDTFLIRLRPEKNIQFQSGDLAAITPKQDNFERLYSIAKIGDDILLSVKKHKFGICSPFLSDLAIATRMNIRIKKNPDFHFPRQAKSVVLIANGTGIAPFLGMLFENIGKIPVHLFLGLRTKKSLQLYSDMLSNARAKEYVSTVNIAYSKENQKKYVQDLLKDNIKIISETLSEGGAIFICGSLAMQHGVLEVLDDITYTELKKPLSDFEQQQQLKMDCY